MCMYSYCIGILRCTLSLCLLNQKSLVNSITHTVHLHTTHYTIYGMLYVLLKGPLYAYYNKDRMYYIWYTIIGTIISICTNTVQSVGVTLNMVLCVCLYKNDQTLLNYGHTKNSEIFH